MIVGCGAAERQRLASVKDVTVIIPVSENHVAFAARAIQSAIESGASVEVVDDSPVSNTVVYQLLRTFNRKIAVTCSGTIFASGVCYARNQAINFAESHLILPLDADDYLLPDAVERMAQAWEPGKVVYGGWATREPIPPEAIIGKGEYDWQMKYDAPPPDMLPRKHICHATYLFAKADWRRVGGYDPIFNLGSEDHEFMIALVEAGCELVRLNGDPLYVKTMGGERTQKAIQRQHLIRQLLIEKHPDFFRTP